jgi:exodeoxyribonuclease-3
MKIATYNVNGVNGRLPNLLEWLDDTQPDVVCLQELKAKQDQIPSSICDLEGYACYWHGAAAYSGVGLHVRRGAFAEAPKFSHPHFDTETRIVQAEVGDTTFASVYVPNGGKDFDAKIAFFRELIAYARGMREAKRGLIVCGDMNIARSELDVHPKERKPRAIGQLPEEREMFEELLREGGLVDVGRKLYPDDEGYFTWWAPWRNLRQRNIGWRLDYVLASESLAQRATSCPSFREIGTSDHAPVVATFA